MKTQNGSIRKRALEETATHNLGLGADLAVITKGSSGSLLATPSASLSIPVMKCAVVDTIGAGDSYMSALILGLLTRATGGCAQPSSNSSEAQRPLRPESLYSGRAPGP